MSLLELTSIHEVDVYPLSQTRDGAGDTVESLGTKTATLSCRVVPLTAREMILFEQRGLVVTHQIQFHADPELTNQTCVVYDSMVLRVRQVENRDGIGWSWIALVEHVPQIEVSAP